METMTKVRTVMVFQDTDPMHPRKEFDNVGTIAYRHSRYTLGEEEIYDPIEWLEDMLGLERKYEYTDRRKEELEDRFCCEYIALPLYLYDHSGISIGTGGFSCPWDSGQVGYIYCTKEKAIKEWGNKICTKKVRERAIRYLEGEIETFDQYLRGDIYGT
jgi:hypothetical protein